MTGFEVTSGAPQLGVSTGIANAAPINSFQVSADASAAALGLNAGVTTADNVDFEIRVSNPSVAGQVYSVVLQSNPTANIQDVITAVQNATNNQVQVIVNATGTGLTLIDTTFQPVVLDSNGKLVSNPNAQAFMVTPINGSAAAVGLGIAGVDSLDATNLDGRIDGRQVTGIKLTDRFFLRDAALGASLAVTTPTGIDANANFGFVGIHLGGNANLTAELSIGLKDPGVGPAADGQISLTEFIAGLSNINTLIDAPSLTGLGQLSLDVGLVGSVPFITLNNAAIGLDANFGDLFNRWDDNVDLTGANPVRVDNTTFELTGNFSDDFLRGVRVTSEPVLRLSSRAFRSTASTQRRLKCSPALYCLPRCPV